MVKKVIRICEIVFLSLCVLFVLLAWLASRENNDGEATKDDCKVIKEEAEEVVEERDSVLNFSVSGFYGTELNRFVFYEPMDIVADNSLGFAANDDKLYAKQGDAIYEVNEDKLVEIYRHTTQISTLIAATDDYILFDSPVRKRVDETEKNVDEIWLYYLSTAETVLLTETESAKGLYDNDELIITNYDTYQDGWFLVYTNLSGDIGEVQCSCIDELPSNYEVYEHTDAFYSIQKRKEDGSLKDTYLTGAELDYEGKIVQRGSLTSQHRGNVQHMALFII